MKKFNSNILALSFEEMKSIERLDLTYYSVNRIESNTLNQYKQLKHLLIRISDLNHLIGNFSFVNLSNINMQELALKYFSDQDTFDFYLICSLKNLKSLKIINEYQGSSNKTRTANVENILLNSNMNEAAVNQNLIKLEALIINDRLVDCLKLNFSLINSFKNLKKLSMYNTDRFYSFVEHNINITSLVNHKMFLNNLNNLEELLIQYAKIYSLNRDNFLVNFPQLKRLSMCLNELETLESYAFSDLENLQELDLSFNSIKQLGNNLFSNLSNLKTLKIFNNKINLIEPYSFKGLKNLSKLDLGINEVEISKNAPYFEHLSNLKSLCLNKNSIENLEPGVFDSLVSLEELDLSYNKIKRLPDYCFRNFSKLKNLNLNGNHLELLELDCFRGLNNLEELSLAHNLIKSLPANPSNHFRDLLKLKILDLSENSIQSLQSETFKGLKSLIKLSLSSNHLTRIERDLFQNSELNNLQILNLSMNQINFVDENAFEALNCLAKCVWYGNMVRLDQNNFQSSRRNVILQDNDDDDDDEDGEHEIEYEDKEFDIYNEDDQIEIQNQTEY